MSAGELSSAERQLDARLDRVVFDQATIAQRVQELGSEISAAYPEGDLLLLGLLKGSFIFVGDLVRHISRPHQVDFFVASSYGRERQSSGQLRLAYEPETDLEGKHILVVEDIVDTGTTVREVLGRLERRGARSLEVCALLHKHAAGSTGRGPRFVGFEAPDEFLVGYGLDHAEDFRHLPYIASLV